MRAGDPSRTRLVLRLIAIERSVRGLLLLAAGTYLLFQADATGRCYDRGIWPAGPRPGTSKRL